MNPEPNHVKIWLVAAGIAIPISWAARFILGFIIYRFVYIPIPYILLWVVLWIAATVVTAVIFYKRNAFQDAPATMGAGGGAGVGFGTGGMGTGAGASGTLAGFPSDGPRVSTSTEGLPDPINTVLVYDRMHCTGELYLAEGELLFVCLKDQTVMKANAGRAVAGQFGLIGALVHAVAASAGEKKRSEELAAAKALVAGLPIADQIQKNPQSFSMPAGQITRFKKGFWTGTYFEAGGKRYAFPEPPKAHFPQIAHWCAVNNIAAEGIK